MCGFLKNERLFIPDFHAVDIVIFQWGEKEEKVQFVLFNSL